MNDRVHGSCYCSPIWYREKWRIYLIDSNYGGRYAFVHDDYDGAPDSNDGRCGHGDTEQDCKNQIDDYEADNGNPKCKTCNDLTYIEKDGDERACPDCQPKAAEEAAREASAQGGQFGAGA